MRSAFEPPIEAEIKGRLQVYFSDQALPKMLVSYLSPQAGAGCSELPHPTQFPGGYS